MDDSDSTKLAQLLIVSLIHLLGSNRLDRDIFETKISFREENTNSFNLRLD